LRGAEDVDHVDRLGDVGELGVDLLAEDLLAGVARIDRLSFGEMPTIAIDFTVLRMPRM
jgi:hypothetical protein